MTVFIDFFLPRAFRAMVRPVAFVAFLLFTIPSGFTDDASVEEAPGSPGVRFFESKVRPVLVKHCYECHSSEADLAEGGLRLDSRAAIRRGGEGGPAVIPRRPAASLLLTAISHTDDDLIMPPEGDKLSDAVIADFEQWIRMGAPDPRKDDSPDTTETWSGADSAADHWAWKTASVVDPPDVENTLWPRDTVDRFILKSLEQNNLAPSADASPAVLIRRLHFDLIGLPPSPERVAEFVSLCASDGIDVALAGATDELLSSEQFGERWGRHWLDVARYAESTGKESNISFPYAWRYRDYVIDSINADIPYDRFLTEQIAGDQLSYDSNAERARLLVATGFLAIGTKNLGERNDQQFNADVVDEQIDTITQAITASSVACARCHHHKFDPFAMELHFPRIDYSNSRGA